MARDVLAKGLCWSSFRIGGDVSSLHAAVELYRGLLQCLRPPNHPGLWLLHFNLGTCTGDLYQETNDIKYLTEGLDCCQCAFGMVDHRNPNRMCLALSLVNSLHMRYERLGAMEDLYGSIGVLKSCVNTPHDLHMQIIRALAYSLSLRYDALGMIDNLEEGIGLLRKAYIGAKTARHERDLS